MSNQTGNSPAQDFSNEVLDVVRQGERDQLRAQFRQGLQDSVLKFGQQFWGSEELIEISEAYPVTATLEASTGNFKGELTVTVSRKNGTTVLETVQYRITRSNGQSGGNKANIDGVVFLVGSVVLIKSPDAMWQDGNWHNWSNSWSYPAIGPVMLLVQFTFDKSGGDPKASASMIFQ